MGAVFGGGASSTVFGSRGAGNFLTLLTKICATVFMLTSLSLSYLLTEQAGERLFDGEIETSEQAPFEDLGAVMPEEANAGLHKLTRWTRPATARLSMSSLKKTRTRPTRPPELVAIPAFGILSALVPRGSGEIGRRTSLRGWRGQPRGGSNPLCRTTQTGDQQPKRWAFGTHDSEKPGSELPDARPIGRGVTEHSSERKKPCLN